MTNYNMPERTFGWDDTITTDAQEFITLEPGYYKFTVKGVERGWYEPNPNNSQSKLPACNRATIDVHIVTDKGEATLKHNLFLHSQTEGLLSAFFGAIGHKKHGQPLQMNWQVVPGATGVCYVNNRQYNGEAKSNIKEMIYADKVDWTKVLNAHVQPAQPTYQPQMQQQYQQPAPQYQQQVPQQQPVQQYQQPVQPVQQAMPQQPTQSNYSNGAF